MPVTSRAKQAQVWARDELDWYVEPRDATRALLSVERFVGEVWDPAAGQGNIVETLLATGLRAYGSDIVRRVADDCPWFTTELDFLADDEFQVGAVNVVTNPPYYRAAGTEGFIRKSLQHASGKVAVFTDMRFLASQRRAAGLYADAPPNRVWVLGNRPSCPPGVYLAAGNEAGNGTADYCWLVWDLTAPPAKRSEIGWITTKFDRSVA